MKDDSEKKKRRICEWKNDNDDISNNDYDDRDTNDDDAGCMRLTD